MSLTCHGLVARAARRRGCRARHRRLARREDHHGRAPVREALAPKQVGRLQMAELDELAKLRLRQRPVLLAVAREKPLRLCAWRWHSGPSGRTVTYPGARARGVPGPFCRAPCRAR